ncbi:MAG: hypothetical protein QME94_15370, partial [Anaerolineae bacterium]|nr:hypothetical protein [Anaerolineae bacterium]
MGVSFQWHSGGQEPVLRGERPAPRGVRPRRWLLALFVVPMLLGGAAAWRVQRQERAVEVELQRLVEQEVLALQAGQGDIFMSLLQGTPLSWRRYHEEHFLRESAWYAARANARVRVESVRLAAEGAWATVALSDGEETWRGTWFFVLTQGRWRHAAAPANSWGAMHRIEAGPIVVNAYDADRVAAEQLAPELEALYGLAVKVYGLPLPVEAGEGDPRPWLSGGIRPAPERITVGIVPWGSGTPARVSITARAWAFDIPSPQLALELWTPEERSTFLRRAARLEVARELLHSAWQGAAGAPNWPLAEALVAWYAQAWQPAWRGYVQASLSDGTCRSFLEAWALEGDPEGLFQALAARYSQAEMVEWLAALNYTVGEYLGERYSSEELG